MATRATAKFALVLLGSYALASVSAALVSVAVWSGLGPEARTALAAAVAEHAGPLIGLAVASASAYVLLVWIFFELYVTAPRSLAQATRLVTHGNASHRLEPVGGAEVRELALAINALADAHEAVQRETGARIADAQRRVQEERDRLAAIISEANQAVLVCNLEGRILLYNDRATQLLGHRTGTSPAVAQAGLVGLGRSVFAILERNVLAHALETIQARLEKGRPAPATFVTASGEQLLRVHVAPVLRGAREAPDVVDGPARGAAESAIAGFVLRIDDVTKPLEAGGRTEAVLQSLTDASRRALANIRAAVETLLAYPGMEPEQQARFTGVIHEEAEALSATLDRTAPEATSLRTEWLLEEILGADLVSAVRSRIESTLRVPAVLGAVDPDVRLRVDSYALARAIVSIAARLRDEGVREVRLALQSAGRRAHLDLAWSGADVATETLARWEEQPLETEGEALPLTLKEVVERHDGAVWYQASRGSATGFFRLAVPVVETEQAPLVLPAAAGARPESYDFDLFHQAGQTPELDERRLTDLAYTAFDTETTGLSPSQGDEIISIGAVRIVNGRLLHQESFEQFVDPRRPVSLASLQITGIDPRVLAGKPPIDQVLPQFHRFCEDTVLVAHNAAFDLRFLQLKEEAAGVRFTHPVLDTLLLAAVIQPDLPSTGLEGIAEQFGVPVLGRHTALGDAIMTGEIFLRMIRVLAERGIVTLRDARQASQRTYLARVKY